LLISYKV